MRSVIQIFLVISFIGLFFVGLISATLKFGILNNNFWQKTFEKHAVYQDLATVFRSSFEEQVGEEGGNVEDVKLISNLMTEENTKDIVDKNIKNILGFVNGKENQINIYLPLSKIQSDLLPQNIAKLGNEIPLTQLLTKLNFQDLQNIKLERFSRLGETNSYLLIGTLCFFSIVSILIFFLTKSGSRFIAPAAAFILSGGITFLLAILSLDAVHILSNDLMLRPSVAAVAVATVLPPTVIEIVYIWKIISLLFLLIGVVLFFVKKPR